MLFLASAVCPPPCPCRRSTCQISTWARHPACYTMQVVWEIEKGVPFSLNDLAKLVQMEHCNRWGKHMLLNSGIIYCPTTRARIPEFMLHLTLGEGASTCLVCDKKKLKSEYLKQQQVLRLLPFLKDSYLAEDW